MNAVHLFTAVLGVLLAAAVAEAQGIIIPRPCPRPDARCPQPPELPQQPLNVKSIRFTTKITDQVAVTHVEQVFENDTRYLLEGAYFFPLPDQVSITEFAMWEGGQRLVGEVRSRDEARRIYDDIVRSRRDPALLEYAGKNLFQASVFPIPPHSEKTIELTYSQVLGREAGTVSYRYPLGVGWQAQGFGTPPPGLTPLPGTGSRRGPAPHRPQTEAGGHSVRQISGVVEIASRAAIKGIYSPTHEFEVKRDGENKARLNFESRSGAQPDFRLFYTLSSQDLGVSLLTHREPGKDGFFLLLVSPKAALDERKVLPKDVIFLLDTSGSMSEQGKIEKAKAALRHGVRSLNPRDRFTIISFAGEEHLMSQGLVAANEQAKKQALEFIEKMRATGGTNINGALMAAIKQLPPGARPQMVVLITDGLPTVGETQVSRILANVKQAATAQMRLFTFGVEYDVNTVLLDRLADENRGTVAYIEPHEDIEVKVSNFFAKVNKPVLSQVTIDWGGVGTDLIYPQVTPDIFHGSQVVLMGRYRPSKRAAATRLTLTGKVEGRERRFVYDGLQFPEEQSGHEFLPYLWAMRRVGYLLDQSRRNGESKELRDEIVELGTRYGIVTPHTSYLVLEAELTRNQAMSNPPTFTGYRSAQVTGGLDGFDRLANATAYNYWAGAAGGATASAGAPLRAGTGPSASVGAGGMSAPLGIPVTGGEAVAFSKEKEALRTAERPTTPLSSVDQIRRAAGKTFYLREGVWTDSEFKAGTALPVVTLKFATDEYFNLAGQEPTLAECFALGERMVVVWKGKVYRVEDGS
jgi:Ca-activated chloride channel family protein